MKQLKGGGDLKTQFDPVEQKIKRGESEGGSGQSLQSTFKKERQTDVMIARPEKTKQLQFFPPVHEGQPDGMSDCEGSGQDQENAGEDDNDAQELDKGVEAINPLLAVLHLEDTGQGLEVIGKTFDFGQGIQRAYRVYFNGRR